MGLCPQTPEVYPLEEYPVKMKKSSNISAAALHRFIPQPASGRSSALPCLAAVLVLLEFWRLLRLHGLFFRPQLSLKIFLSQKCYTVLIRCSIFIISKYSCFGRCAHVGYLQSLQQLSGLNPNCLIFIFYIIRHTTLVCFQSCVSFYFKQCSLLSVLLDIELNKL